MLKVSAYMTDKVLTARPDDGIREAFFRMRRENIRHLPVVDRGGRLLGIISDRDLRRPDWVDEAPDLSHLYVLDDSIQVENLMTRNVVTVHAHDSLDKATRLLLRHRFGALPVLSKGGKLVGILSALDLLRALDELLTTQDHR